MNERSLTTRAIAGCRDLPGSFVLKLSDRFTSGVPDFIVYWHEITWWIEVKHIRLGCTLKDELKPAQDLMLRKFGSRGLLLVFHEDRNEILGVTGYTNLWRYSGGARGVVNCRAGRATNIVRDYLLEKG